MIARMTIRKLTACVAVSTPLALACSRSEQPSQPPAPENAKNADFHDSLWVDPFDALGLGKDGIVVNGTGSDSLLAFDPVAQKLTTLRVPYPQNTYTRWNGRGLWFNDGLDPTIHSEIPQSYVGVLQLRPDPLTR